MSDQQRERLLKSGREIGKLLDEAMPPGVGYGLILFDFGEGGFLSWISNAQREDMAKTLRALLARWDAGAGNDDRQS